MEHTELTLDALLGAILNLQDMEIGGGGGKILLALAALGPERYNALSKLLHDCGLCGGEGA